MKRFVRLAGPFFRSEDKWIIRGIVAALLVLTIGQMYFLLRVNIWSKGLFDSLEQRAMDELLGHTAFLALILACLMSVNATHLWLKRALQLRWRRWLSRRLLVNWMDQGRHYQVTFIGGAHDNPDGRIAEDVRISTETAIDLAHSLIYCALLLVGFTKVLWELSGVITITVAEVQIPVHGHMVWVALLYAGIGSTLAFLFGRPLIRAVDRRQTAEANFRFSLVHARENSEAIALLKGEEDERRRLINTFDGIKSAWRAQSVALMRIFVFSSGYSVLSTVFPVLVSSPRYIAGVITLGALMQMAQAFQQMVQALSWPVDNIPRVAEWRASVERVLQLDHALEEVKAEVARKDEGHVRVEQDGPALTFRDLRIGTPDGRIVSNAFSAEITQGERVLITGDPATGVRLFKIVAGLWPWGRGTVSVPGDTSIFFMPQRPYLPITTLRDAVTYPSPPGSFADIDMAALLERVGLPRLVRRLDEVQTWERVLTMGEQQRLGFARLLLHRPRWIFLQEATDALDHDSETEMMKLLDAEFPEAAVLTVGFHDGLERFHGRKIELLRSPDGCIAVEEKPIHEVDPHKFRLRPAQDRRKWLFSLLGQEDDWHA